MEPLYHGLYTASLPRLNNEDIKSTEQDNELFSKNMISFFSTPGHYHAVFFQTKNTLFASLDNLDLMFKIARGQLATRNRDDKYSIRHFRGTRFENQVWKLGMHLRVNPLLPNGVPILNISVPTPTGHVEIDVGFSAGKILELIECKSDIALNVNLQEKYF